MYGSIRIGMRKLMYQHCWGVRRLVRIVDRNDVIPNNGGICSQAQRRHLRMKRIARVIGTRKAKDADLRVC